MLRPGSGVRVRCNQCADPTPELVFEVCVCDEIAALVAAVAAGWLVAPDGRLLCSACGPVLVCEAEGHVFTGWRRPVPGRGEPARTCRCAPGAGVHLLGSGDCGRVFRYCRRCCLHESATTTTVGVE